MYDKFVCDVSVYKLFWEEMDMIDSKFNVLDPKNPTKIDCYRRLSLLRNAYIKIVVDPRNALEIPEIEVIGPEHGKKEKKTYVCAFIFIWMK